MNTFRNLNELNSIWTTQTIGAINYVTEKTVNAIKDEMEKLGIGQGSFSTGEFEEAFVNDIANKVANIFIGNFYYDSFKISTIDPEGHIHASDYFEDGGIAVEGLPDIVFKGEGGGLFGDGYWTKPRDAWNLAGDVINSNIDKWFRDGFKKNGIMIK